MDSLGGDPQPQLLENILGPLDQDGHLVEVSQLIHIQHCEALEGRQDAERRIFDLIFRVGNGRAWGRVRSSRGERYANGCEGAAGWHDGCLRRSRSGA